MRRIQQFTSPVRRLGIEAGLEDIGDLRVTAVSIVIVIVYTVALHVTNPILSLPVVARPQPEAVSSIMARFWVVALRVTSAITDLSNSTVAEDKPLFEAGVSDVVHTEI